MKTGDAIAEILKREGVEWIIGYPVNHILEHGAAACRHPASAARPTRAGRSSVRNFLVKAVYDQAGSPHQAVERRILPRGKPGTGISRLLMLESVLLRPRAAPRPALAVRLPPSLFDERRGACDPSPESKCPAAPRARSPALRPWA